MICFTICRTKIQVSFWFVALLTVLLLIDNSGLVVYGIAASFIHEAGHIFAAFIIGKAPKLLSFEATGIRMVENRYFHGFLGEIFVLGAGCLFNGIAFVFAKNFGYLSFASVNLCIGLFNLLPNKFLDGGKILHEILCRVCPLRFADSVMFVLSLLIAVLFFCAGIHFLCLYYNPTLLMVAVYLITTLFCRDY